MWSIVSLIVLALIAWFVYRMLKRNSTDAAATRDPLDHDRDGLNRPLPGQRAAIDGEVHDAARGHVGGHLEESTDGRAAGEAVPGGTPAGSSASGPRAGDGDTHRVEASVRTQEPPPAGTTGQEASVTDSFGHESATVAVPGSPDPAATDPAMDADTAARAARRSENTGGTGTAVLAGIATAAGAGAAAVAAGRDDEAPRQEADARDDAGDGGSDEDRHAERTNAPDPETAGALELEGRHTDSAAALRDAEDAARSGSPAAMAGETDTATGERDPARDDARTNAPIGDTSVADAARDPVEPVPGDAGAAAAATDPSAAETPSERANAPDADGAGGPGFRDRSIDARSNLVAGTVTLATGGATAEPGAAVLEDGRTPAEQAARLADAGRTAADAERLANGDRRENVREMMKILNLREGDASRLGISKEDFARLWQRDAGADDALVDDVAARLRRMLG